MIRAARQSVKMTALLRDETSEEFGPLSLSLFPLPASALQADRSVRTEAALQPDPVVSANSGKDVMALRDKQRYPPEDVSLT